MHPQSSVRRLWAPRLDVGLLYHPLNSSPRGSMPESGLNFDDFAKRLRANLPEGTVLNNPGGGTSAVIWVDDSRVCYQRGRSRFYVGLRSLYGAYAHFAGGKVTTRQLKDYAPGIFDSTKRGHNCHCTFLFLALQQMGMVEQIYGQGHAGSPFGVTINPAGA